MIFFYRILTTLIYPILILIIYYRKIINKEDKLRFREKIFPKYFNVKKNDSSKLLWFHAASIGELKSIIPIIEEINKKYSFEILITTTTLSSSELAKEKLKNFSNVYHRFFPVDVFFVIKKFLILWKPSAIFLVDSEIWPNLILGSKEREIPIALINARITKKTFNKWMIVPETAKKIFGNFNLCLASNMETKDYLTKLNVKNNFYTGNIKLYFRDNNYLKNLSDLQISKKNKTWCAISTHIGEEKFCLKTHLILKKNI